MTFRLKKLMPYFAAALLAGLPLRGDARQKSGPEVPVGVAAAYMGEELPETIAGWRDVFTVRASRPEEAAALTGALDRLFTNPAVEAALEEQVARNRALADYIASHDGANLTTEEAADAVYTARHKVFINALSTASGSSGGVQADSVTVRRGKERVTLLLHPVIYVPTASRAQYLGTDGKYHDFTSVREAAHELGHVLKEESREQEAVRWENAWMSGVEPGQVRRGDYFLSRLKPDAPECRAVTPAVISRMAEGFARALKNKDPADAFPVIRSEKGKVLRGKAALKRMARMYYAGCS